MPFPSHLLTDKCLISRFTGREDNAFATATYGPWVVTRCAFQDSNQKVRDADGNERVSAFVIVTKERINLEDRVILPTANGSTPTIPTTDDEVEAAVTPIALRNDRNRRSGFRLYQTFF